MTTSMKIKKTLVRKSVFPKPPTNLFKSPVISSGMTYIKITKEVVAKTLIMQIATKAPGLDKINLQIF